MQKWKKLGLVFCANNNSHSMVNGGRAPVALKMEDDNYRIYFASYDQMGRGRVFFLELNIENPSNLLFLQETPVLDIGQVGFYDDNGIIPSWVLIENNQVYLYTIGFSVKNKVIFDAASGFAVSKDQGITFKKHHGSIIDRSLYDPCFAASPTVVKHNNIFHMWYVSCDHWVSIGSGYRHFYNIKHRTSIDGIHWYGIPDVSIDYANEHEYAISRPSVLIDKSGLFRMWYSFRAQPGIETYRIGYAESKDGLNWERKDHLMKGFDVSLSGWDSEMICYPYVFEHKGLFYMLYNGNGYGKTGFGLAVLESE